MGAAPQSQLHVVYGGTYDNVTVPPNRSCNLSNSTVHGSVTVQTNSSLDLENSGTVGGSLLVGTAAPRSRTPAGSSPEQRRQTMRARCRSPAFGDPLVGGSWLIAGPRLDGSPQEMDGNVVLTDNQVPMYVFDNYIRQNLVCEGNNPAPFTSLGEFGNTVDGHSVGQCATTNSATGANAARDAP